MVKRRDCFWLSLILIFALLVAACGGPRSASEPTRGDVLVYVAVPLSGFQANAGQTVLGGARLKAAEVNAQGGLDGYRVVVEALDDESDNDVAVAVAEQIAASVAAGERVLGVIGHLNSGQTLAAMEIYKDLPITVVTPTASEVSLTQKGYPNFFRVNASDDVQARVDAEFLANTLGARRIAILHNDDPYGVGLADAVAANLKTLGAEVVTQIQVAVEQSDYSLEVPQVVAASPDAVFYAGYEVECPYLRYALTQAGVDVPFLASDGCFLSATIDESNETAEGMYVSAFGPSPWTTAGDEWIKAYQEVEYRNPDTYSLNGYTAMEVLLSGAQKANDFGGLAVANAIQSLDFESLLGHISYQPTGDLKDPTIYIFRVQGGKFVQVFPGD
ncbi:MAG: branched-chain amino acid ABC transporter substrate-binding protein [Anaerolineae bacterium]